MGSYTIGRCCSDVCSGSEGSEYGMKSSEISQSWWTLYDRQ
jgi:hypothetical protein